MNSSGSSDTVNLHFVQDNGRDIEKIKAILLEHLAPP